MASFDVKSIFTNILLPGTIGLCHENLYRNHTHIVNLSKGSTFFIFDQKFYKQCDGVAMGSTLGPELDNFENILLENCPTKFKRVVDRIYVVKHFYLFVQQSL